jgi:hypothetical protein
MPRTVGSTGPAVTIEPKILFVENGLFALPLQKNEVSGFGQPPCFASSRGGYGRFLGRVIGGKPALGQQE